MIACDPRKIARGGLRFRSLGCGARGLVQGLAAALILAAGACGSDPAGINFCRRIETARCGLAHACGTLENVGDCERFYRDHCLHGLGVPIPPEREVEGCAIALETAAECTLTESSAPECENACALVARPERALECGFLSSEAPDPEEPGGQGGSGGEDGEPAEAGAGGAAEASGR